MKNDDDPRKETCGEHTENVPFEVAMRCVKRTMEKNGLLIELRAREFYEKPTAERKRRKAAAVKHHFKHLRGQMLPKKFY